MRVGCRSTPLEADIELLELFRECGTMHHRLDCRTQPGSHFGRQASPALYAAFARLRDDAALWVARVAIVTGTGRTSGASNPQRLEPPSLVLG